MAITLIGEIVNSADTTTGFSNGNISDDDDFVEGVGALGDKTSAGTESMYVTTSANLGATAPYDFSSGGTDEGSHIIMWFNSKTPLNTTTGMRILVGDGTNRGEWYVYPRGFYKGGFTTKVVGTDRDFDNIDAGAWTLAGNPAQLTAVSQMGATFTTITSIMGSFNNVQIDQFTLGSGLRVDAGTVGSPNTFETVRAADEDTDFFGWWSSSQGAVVGKGKLYIGPQNETSTSVFNDSAFSVIFADENISSGFYSFEMIGTGTDITWDLANISSADISTTPFTRWIINTATDLKSFSDTNGTWQNFDYVTLGTGCTLTGTSLIDGRQVTQNSGLLDGCSVIEADRGDGESFLLSDYPSRIQNCTFTQDSGHAIELTSLAAGKTITFTGNSFTGYEGPNGTNGTANSGPTNAAIYNNSGGDVTLNVVNGQGNLSVRNGTGATTTVVQAVTLTLGGIIADSDSGRSSEVRVYTAGTTTELGGSDGIAVTGDGRGSFAYSFEQGDPNVDIRIFNVAYQPVNFTNFALPISNTTIPVQQIFDRNYDEGQTPFP